MKRLEKAIASVLLLDATISTSTTDLDYLTNYIFVLEANSLLDIIYNENKLVDLCTIPNTPHPFLHKSKMILFSLT